MDIFLAVKKKKMVMVPFWGELMNFAFSKVTWS
jgi:hypothetical protein